MPPPPATSTKPILATPQMCHYSFTLLHHTLHPTPPRKTLPPPTPSPQIPNSSTCALFITLKTLHTHKPPTLRGCIGTLTPTPCLHTALTEYTTAAAFRDRRFPPLRYEELKSLEVGVSLLSEFVVLEKGRWEDWVIGVHGLIVEFDGDVLDGREKGRRRASWEFSATYLPEVCEEQGWGKGECLRNLVGKSGWRGRVGKEVLEKVRITRYRSVKCEVPYGEWDSVRKMNGVANGCAVLPN